MSKTPPTSPSLPPDTVPEAGISDQAKRALFEDTIAVAEQLELTPEVAPENRPTAGLDTSDLGQVAASLPQAVDELVSQQTPQQTATAGIKERMTQSSMETGATGGAVEYEPSSELPPEVESYITKVTDHTEQLPQEVVIAGDAVHLTQPTYAAQPVVVLPVTQMVEEVGRKKNTTFSVRWLVEWSQKMIKLFAGKVVYRPE